jgi:hypothetical protein
MTTSLPSRQWPAAPAAPLRAAPPSLPAHVHGLLRGFEQTRHARACEQATGAYANCLAVSARCGQWLRAHGVECGILHVAGGREPFPAGVGRWPFCDPTLARHWVVRAGDWTIDWTARQFDALARWPAVDPIDALAARWRLVEDWACPRCPDLVTDHRHLELAPIGLDREHGALARASSGCGPFGDPRHDDTPALVRLCGCSCEQRQGRPAQSYTACRSVSAA